jgi:nucleotide-binding universal stress UspA family protein
MSSEVLVPFDESPQSTAALHHALSTYLNAEIRVLHVHDPQEWTSAAGMGIERRFYSEKMFEQAQESGRKLLEEAESIAGEYDRTVTTATEVGETADVIVQYAEDQDVDHIVLGSHGRQGLSRFLLGSVAETVVRRSPGSVTIIRELNLESEH